MLRREEVKNKNELLCKLHDSFEEPRYSFPSGASSEHVRVLDRDTEATNIHNVNAIYHGMGRPMRDSSSEDD